MRYGKLYKLANVNSKLIDQSLAFVNYKTLNQAAVANKDAKEPISRVASETYLNEAR